MSAEARKGVMSPNSVDPNDLMNATRTATEYWEALCRIIPISIVGGFVSVVTHLNKIAAEKTWLRRIFVCLSVIGIGCVAGGVAVLGITLFLPAPTPELEILAGALAGAAGQKTFDVYWIRIFGDKYVPKRRSTDFEHDNSD